MENPKVLLPPKLLLLLKNFFQSTKPYNEIIPYDGELRLNHREYQSGVFCGDEEEKLTVLIETRLIGIDLKNSTIYNLKKYIGMNSEKEPKKNKNGVAFKKIRHIKDISFFVYAEIKQGFFFDIKIMKGPNFSEEMLNDVQRLYQKYYLEKDGDMSFHELEKIE